MVPWCHSGAMNLFANTSMIAERLQVFARTRRHKAERRWLSATGGGRTEQASRYGNFNAAVACYICVKTLINQ